jgi:beta-phosphoglucomutase-like phosphatase (HAD superfamily)
MNIIIPLCGKGERFKNNGFKESKPLIKVFEKYIIFYLLDNLDLKIEDEIYFFYHSSLDLENFKQIISSKFYFYKLHFISISRYTKGASETLKLGIEQCLNTKIIQNRVTVCLVCDNFYTVDFLTKIRDNVINKNFTGGVINTINTDLNPIYSYVKINEDNLIDCIKEKEKISNIINTGCYFFNDLNLLKDYCDYVSDELKLYVKNECYISCVIKKMLEDGYLFNSILIDSKNYFNLGTPKQVEEYIDKTHAFLFDLDGTLVITDDVYFEVWKEILQEYNIIIDQNFYKKYILGNTDLHVLNTVLFNINLSLEILSKKKDQLFINKIEKIKLLDGVFYFFQKIKNFGHKLGIVTNCNREVAEKIINHFNLNAYIDCLIIGNECIKSKPSPEPYLRACEFLNISHDKVIIFEDSKSGLLSAKNMFPKKLIAVNKIYENEVYNQFGVYKILENFLNISIDYILNDDNLEYNKLKLNIINSLSKNNLFQDEKILEINIDKSKLKGGYISDVISLEIKTNLNIYNTVLKLENRNDSFLSRMAQNLGLYEREYYFYEKISKFCPISIPRFYGIIYDENNKEIGILLENLYKKEMISNLNLNVESIENSLKIIDECAKLHTKFWGKNLSYIFLNLKKHNDTLFNPVWKNFMQEKWNNFKDKWKFILKDYHINLLENVINNFEHIQDYLSKDNLTLCHGDVKSLNMFFKREMVYHPYFIDWQYINYGKGVQDIVFFLIESFEIEKIKEYHTLIREYYFIKCKEYGIKKYTINEYKKDFVYSIFYFPLFVSIWFGTLSQDDLIDKNFPYFFIQKFLFILDLYKDDINLFEKSITKI